MKWLLTFLIVAFIAVGVGLLMQLDTGYVLISFNHWTVETTLWMLILAIFVLFLLLHFLLKLCGIAGSISQLLKKWHSKHKRKVTHKLLQGSVCAWNMGMWKLTEKLAKRSIIANKTSLISYLLAADAAQQQGDLIARDRYLNMATHLSDKLSLPTAFVRARLQLHARQYSEALVTLQYLQQKMPKNPQLLKLLQRVYVHLNDHKGLLTILPNIRKAKIYSADQLSKLELDAYSKMLQKSAKYDSEATVKLWDKIPTHITNNPMLVVIYVQLLLNNKRGSAAEKILTKILPKIWDVNLVELYGKTQGTIPSKQITVAESWLQKHPEDPALLLCLGRLCKRQKLWGKAQIYLQLSAKLSPNCAVYRELAEIMESLGNNTAALNYYKKENSTFP